MRISDEQAQLLALCQIKGVNWYFIAREAQRHGGLTRLLRGETTEQSAEALKATAIIRDNIEHLDYLAEQAVATVEHAKRGADASLVTVVDSAYPANLRLIFNLPPFLFVRGAFTEDDVRSVAVVGTRQASPDGVQRAAKMSRLLCEHGVTVVSGLARGIDTSAHTAALEAGGRTIAVVGTGILKTYPAENKGLANQISANGAIVSQFWPDGPPATYTFPRRNVTMSGIAQGTAVIEASSTSGAKMQARLALEHGKKAFLLRSLTENQEWAQRYVETRGAIMVDEVEDVVQALVDSERIHAADARRAQLALEFG